VSPGIRDSDPRLLARLMDVGAGPGRLWQPGELGAVFQHQLSAVIQFDLGGLDQSLANRVRNLSAAEGLLIKSFRDLFCHPHPPVELLDLTKDFAKACKNHPDSPLPGEVASVLYFLSIAVAMAKCGARISQLDDDSLRTGLEWASGQPWLDEQTRNLLVEGLNALQGQARAEGQ